MRSLKGFKSTIIFAVLIGFAIIGVLHFRKLADQHRPEPFTLTNGIAAPEPAPIQVAPVEISQEAAPKVESDPFMVLAERQLEEHRRDWNIQSYHELRPEVTRDPLGATVVYQIYQDGIPVGGMTIRMRFSREQQLEQVDNGYRPIEYLSVKDAGSPAQTMDAYRGSASGNVFGLLENQEQVAPVIWVSEAGESSIAYGLRAMDKHRRPVTVFARAGDGQVLSVAYARQEFSTRFGSRQKDR